MATSVRKLASAVAVGAALLMGAGCAAVPGPVEEPVSVPITAIEDTSAIELLGQEPCGLLTTEQAALFDLVIAEGVSGLAGGLRTCTWELPAETAADDPPSPLVLGIQPGITLSAVRSGGVVLAGPGPFEEAQVGGFPALRATARSQAANQCTTLIDVGSGILAVFGARTCVDAERIGGLVLGNLQAPVI